MSGPVAPTAKEQRQLEAAQMGELMQSLAPYTPRIYVTWALMGVCIGVWLLQVVLGVHPISPTTSALQHWGGDYGPLTTHGQWWRTVTSMFLHAGVIHLAMNMLVLWSIGRFMERLLGNAGFLVLYIFAGVAGSFVSMAWQPTVTSVGASGALFGLYGALAGFLLRAHGTLPTHILKQLWRMAGAFVFYNLIYGLNIPGIDMAAHLGGLAGGFVGGLVLGHALEPGAFARRPQRAIALALIGALGFAVLTLRMPRYTDAFQDEMDSLDKVEQQAFAVFKDILEKSQQKKMNDAAVADAIAQQLLPPWRAETERLRALHHLPARQDKVRNKILVYMNTRAEGWQLIVDGVRQNSEDSVKKGFAKQEEAMQLTKKLGND